MVVEGGDGSGCGGLVVEVVAMVGVVAVVEV